MLLIEIRCIPTRKSQVHPDFMNECTTALSKCANLNTFMCYSAVTPLFIRCFQDKPSLSNLRINGSMPTQAAQKLVQVRGLAKLAIDHGSWNLLDILPSWTSNLKQTLSSLTLSVSSVEPLKDCLKFVSELHRGQRRRFASHPYRSSCIDRTQYHQLLSI